MSEIDINQLLSQMRTMEAQAKGASQQAGNDEAGGADFAAMLRQSIDKVNEMQQEAGKMATALELGDPNVDLAQVMVALQKASVSFQAMTQVRNRLLSAYQDIMNMQL
jgi:flagellar hook-basal body complex protein FliE